MAKLKPFLPFLFFFAAYGFLFKDFAENAFSISDTISTFVTVLFLALFGSLAGKYFFPNKTLWTILTFILVFLAIRIPFYEVFLHGEDGLFADIYLNNPTKPNFWLIGQIHGVKHYLLIHHPAIPFEYLSFVGGIFQAFLPFEKLTDIELSFFIRLMHSISLLGAWLILFFTLNKKFLSAITDPLRLLLIFLVANLPIAILMSTTEIHIDQSFGVLSTALLIAALYHYHSSFSSASLLLFSSLIFNLGKNEWAFCFLMAVGVLAFLKILLKYFKGEPVDYLMLSALILGCLLGNVLSYSYDPANYLSGLDLMIDTAYKTTFAKYLPRIDIIPEQFIHLTDEKFNKRDYTNAIFGRMEFIAPLLIFIILLIWGSIQKSIRWADDCTKFLGILGLLLFLAFFSTAHSKSVRFFSISYMILSFLFISQWDFQSSKARVVPWALVILFSFAMFREFSLQINVRNKHDKAYFMGTNPSISYLPVNPNCIGFYPPAIFNRKHDYLIDWGERDLHLRNKLAAEHQLKVCEKKNE